MLWRQCCCWLVVREIIRLSGGGTHALMFREGGEGHVRWRSMSSERPDHQGLGASRTVRYTVQTRRAVALGVSSNSAKNIHNGGGYFEGVCL